MPTFIKAGLWFKARTGHKGTLDLDNLIKETVSTPVVYQDFDVSAEPPTPPSGHIRMYVDLTGTLMIKNDAGIVKEVQLVNL